MNRHPEFDADDATPGDPPGVAIASSDDEYDLTEYRQSLGDLSSEYGEVEEYAKSTRNEHVLPKGFYKKSVRRQNCFFGISLMHIFAAFVGAYFLMGMSFTRSNIGTFGDESAMEGSSGEVGIDADNAEVQEIIDEEIVELEEAGNWGDNAKRVDSNQRFKDLIKIRDKDGGVGKNKWTEQKQWWEENKDHLDESKMSKKEIRIADRFKKKEERQKQHEERKKRHKEERKRKKKKNAKAQKDGDGNNSATDDTTDSDSATADATDLDLITDHISEHYNFTEAHPGGKRDKNRPRNGPGGNKTNRAKANKEQANSGSNENNNPTRAKANKEQKVTNDFDG